MCMLIVLIITIICGNYLTGVIALCIFDYTSKIHRKSTELNDFLWCLCLGYFIPVFLLYVVFKVEAKNVNSDEDY